MGILQTGFDFTFTYMPNFAPLMIFTVEFNKGRTKPLCGINSQKSIDSHRYNGELSLAVYFCFLASWFSKDILLHLMLVPIREKVEAEFIAAPSIRLLLKQMGNMCMNLAEYRYGRREPTDWLFSAYRWTNSLKKAVKEKCLFVDILK